MSKLDPIGLHKVREYNPDRVRTKLFCQMYFSTSVTISPYRRRLRRCDLPLVDVTLTRPSWIPCVTYNRLFFLRDLQLAVLFAWPAICCSFCVTCDWSFFLQGAPNSAVWSKPVGLNQPTFCITLFSAPTKNNNLMFAALIAFRNGDEVNKREGGGERLSIPPHLGFSSLIVDLYLKYPRWRPSLLQRNNKRLLFENEYVQQGGCSLHLVWPQLMTSYTRNWVPVPFRNPLGQISGKRKSSPRPSKNTKS